ncbi:MAG: polyprenyl synthetase family protein [Bacteroidales bacterium]|nr:polyprenyl synthetase family protein [Bacteroidales bacterium]MCF8404047.1 polyprenyl synthetase family protein [Bacteroidales bacterium]
MSKLNEIKAPIQSHLDIFEKKFRASMKSNVALLDIITRYILKRKGKQMRPMFVFLSAGIHGEIKEPTYIAASLIELLHTATLVHDDVVDDSNERRGFFSINALWKNKVAVLVGDYLFSKGMLLSLNSNEFELLRIVSDATKDMSEGELLQIEKARKLDIDEAIYFEIIRKKTASLIASCCAAGAASVGSDEATIKLMKDFGEKVGIAFQIKDDLFDYQTANKTGKPNGIDIKEQKMTLPLIYLLNNVDRSEKRKIINIIKNHNTNPAKVKFVIDKVNHSGGIEYAAEKMNSYHKEALDILKGLPDSPSKTSLKKLVDFTIERKK